MEQDKSPTHSTTSRISLRSNRSKASVISSTDSVAKSDTWVKYLPPDAGEPELCPKDFRYKVFPVEILFTFFCYAVVYYSSFAQQYYYQYVMRTNVSSSLPTNNSICVNQTYMTSFVSNASYIDLQKDVNEINMFCNVIYMTLAAITGLFIGPLSDIYGRKPALLFILLGAVLQSVVQIFISFFNADARYYYLVSFLNGGSGGFLPFLHICFAAVTDVTKSVKWRTVRMSVLESSVNVGQALSSLTVFYLIPYVNCNFRIPVWFIFGSLMLALIYLLLFPEPLRKVHHTRPPNELKSKFLRLFNGFKLYLVPRKLGWNKWACLCLATLLIGIYGMVIIGEFEVLTYFVQNKPLEWDYKQIGAFNAGASAVNWACLFIMLPLLVAVGISNPVICLISSVFGIGTCVGMALLNKGWEMYLAKSLQGICYLGFPALRSIVSQTVDAEDMGAVFTIISSVQTLAVLISTVAFNSVYRPESHIEGHTVDAGMVFWIMAGCWALSIPFVLLLMIVKRKGRVPRSHDSPEVQGLLSDSSISNYGSVSDDIRTSTKIQ